MTPLSVILLGTCTRNTLLGVLRHLLSSDYPGDMQIILVDVFRRYRLDAAMIGAIRVECQPGCTGARPVQVIDAGPDFSAAVSAGLRTAVHESLLIMTPGYVAPGFFDAAGVLIPQTRAAFTATGKPPRLPTMSDMTRPAPTDWQAERIDAADIRATRQPASTLDPSFCLLLHRRVLEQVDAPLPHAGVADFAATLRRSRRFFQSPRLVWLPVGDSTAFPETVAAWRAPIEATPGPIDIAVISNGDRVAVPACLRGLHDQTWQPRRVYLCLDGTEDMACADEFLDKLPLEIWSLPPDGRPFRAASLRNVALWQAAAPRILYVDQDMILEPWVVDGHARYGDTARCVYGPRTDVPQGRIPANATEAFVLSAPSSAGSIPTTLPFVLTGMNPPVNLGDWFDLGTYNASFPVREARAVGGFCSATFGRNWEDIELLGRMIRAGVEPVRRSDLMSYHLDHPRGPHATTPANWQRLLETLNDPEMVQRSPDTGLTASARLLARSPICE